MASILLNVDGDIDIHKFDPDSPILAMNITAYAGECDPQNIYQKDTVYFHGSGHELRAFFLNCLRALGLDMTVASGMGEKDVVGLDVVDVVDGAEGSESSNSPIDWADVMAPV